MSGSRVLLAGFCAVPGANRAGVQLLHVLRGLKTRYPVDLMVTRGEDQPHMERRGKSRILRVPMPSAGAVAQVEAYRRALRRQLEGAEYEIVHVRDGCAAGPVLELQPHLGYAVVFDATRGPLAEPPPLNPALGARLSKTEKICMTRADLVLVPNARAQGKVPGTRRERIHVVPVGVDVDKFDWDSSPPGRAPIILYAGTLEPGRGVRVLLRAMVDVARRSDAVLAIAGSGASSFEGRLREAIVDLGLKGRVQMLGPVEHDEMPALIADAAVCVASSALDTQKSPFGLFPTKILEYMACRRPVVAPRKSSIADVMKEGVHGLLFEPGDPNDLSRALLRLIRDTAMRSSLAEAGYEHVRRHHTASATRRALRDAYVALMSDPDWHRRREARKVERPPTGERTAPYAPGFSVDDSIVAGAMMDDITGPSEITDVERQRRPRGQFDSAVLTAVAVAADEDPAIDPAAEPPIWPEQTPRQGDHTAPWERARAVDLVVLDPEPTPTTNPLHVAVMPPAGDDDSEEISLDGTPVRGTILPRLRSSPLPSIEQSFVSGEVMVSSPSAQERQSAARPASVLVGGDLDSVSSIHRPSKDKGRDAED